MSHAGCDGHHKKDVLPQKAPGPAGVVGFWPGFHKSTCDASSRQFMLDDIRPLLGSFAHERPEFKPRITIRERFRDTNYFERFIA